MHICLYTYVSIQSAECVLEPKKVLKKGLGKVEQKLKIAEGDLGKAVQDLKIAKRDLEKSEQKIWIVEGVLERTRGESSQQVSCLTLPRAIHCVQFIV